MKSISKVFIAFVLTILGSFGIVTAGEEPVSYAAVEIYACNFQKGKGMDDLARVTKKWNAWMDSSNGPDYTAYNLFPLYHSAELGFDVAWLGVWADGVSMAAGTKHWLTQGGSLHDDFGKVIECDAHQNFAALTVKPEDGPSSDGPVEFSNCTVKKGSTVAEAVAAISEWSSYETEKGSDAATYILFPAYGESSKAKYDFKHIQAYPSYESFGLAYDRYGTGGGYRAHRKIVERVMSCDSARVYDSKAVRVPK
jgi:hypothetical protein